MPTLRTEIRIAAPPRQVWEILTDLAGYARWNPFILQASGDVVEGSRIRVRIQPPGKGAMTFRPRLLRVDPGRELRWLGHLGIPGVFDGEHRFRLEEDGSGTRMIHEESFRGILVPLLWPGMEEATRAGFEGMNRALKERVEGGVAAGLR